MRSQISLEFLIYIAVSAASLVIVLSLYMKGSVITSSIGGKASLEEMVASINANMGYQEASFITYIPQAVCDSRFTGRSVAFSNTSYYFDSNVSINQSSACAYGGEIAEIQMLQYPNQTFLVDFSGARP
ncbi:MAG: hypothetical protein LVQ95_04435 [Candidatus Micrarchaeales archaeon]|nr:hypothetical protein [Candidatus Micrarchaeales archaeon]